MKPVLPLVRRMPLVLALLALPALCGCTAALWDRATFAQHYRPARPSNLRLSYSKERQDILVQYNESRDGDPNARLRSYWLEPNTPRVNRDRKPHFVSADETSGLIPIPVSETAPQSTNARPAELCAVALPEDLFFTLYLGAEKQDPYKLPAYAGSSQRVKQVLLTPFALGIDATILGAVIAYFSLPSLGNAIH
jgi:hypothetical protein